MRVKMGLNMGWLVKRRRLVYTVMGNVACTGLDSAATRPYVVIYQ